MHEHCPVCGLRFEREQGYFVGAMYVGYVLMLPPSALICYILWRITGRFGDNLFLWTFLAALPLVPAVLRWSRVLWLHLDWRFDPDPADRKISETIRGESTLQ